MHILSNAISTLQPLIVRSSISVFCGVFFYSLNEVHLLCAMCMLQVSWLLIWFALLWMDSASSIVILSLLIFFNDDCQFLFFFVIVAVVDVILSLLHSTLIRLFVTICVQAAHLHWHSSSFMVQIEFNTLESPLKWSFNREGASECERENENIYLRASGHAWKRDKWVCVYVCRMCNTFVHSIAKMPVRYELQVPSNFV